MSHAIGASHILIIIATGAVVKPTLPILTGKPEEVVNFKSTLFCITTKNSGTKSFEETKSHIIVTISGIVPVADGGASVVSIVVPRTATQVLPPQITLF